MEQLARECCLSRSHFSRAFHGSTGMSPHQWLTRQRIERARALLLGQCTLTHIAQDCGFADQAHFSRVFARMAGMPPSQWRLERLRSSSQRNGA
jgi:AraC-like DNA-binding protein